MRIDAHSHVPGLGLGDGRTADDLIAAMDALEIDIACVSLPIVSGNPPPERVREANDVVLAAMARFPARLVGYCYVNPGYPREALAEMERCILDRGMVGLKLYLQYAAHDPVVYSVIERATVWRIPVLWHANNGTDLLRDLVPERGAASSHAGHIADLAARYPEAMLIEGHIGGGGDWEWAIKTLREADSVYLDTSGSVIDEGMVDMAARELGVDRLLFATDLSMEAGVGKLLAAELTEAEREAIFWRNMQAILDRRRTP